MISELSDDRGLYSDEERAMMREAGIEIRTPDSVSRSKNCPKTSRRDGQTHARDS